MQADTWSPGKPNSDFRCQCHRLTQKTSMDQNDATTGDFAVYGTVFCPCESCHKVSTQYTWPLAVRDISVPMFPFLTKSTNPA